MSDEKIRDKKKSTVDEKELTEIAWFEFEEEDTSLNVTAYLAQFGIDTG